MNDIQGVIRYEKTINTRNIYKLITEIEEKLLKFKKVVIYFSTDGGATCETRVLVDYLNTYSDRIELVGVWQIASSGFDVFLYFTGNKRLLGSAGTHSVIHLTDCHYSQVDLMDKKSFAYFDYTNLKRDHEAYLAKLKPLLTDSEFNTVASGEDLFIDDVRLSAILQCPIFHVGPYRPLENNM